MSQPQESTRRYAFEQFTAVRRYQPALSFSPDGTEIAYSTNTSGQFNLWRQSTTGGYPHQLTLFTEQAVREIAWAPDGQSILFTADVHGDEFYQLYRIPARGGLPEQLTDAPRVQHYLAGEPWSPDGRTIAYAGNDRAPTDQDVLVHDVTTGAVRRVYQGGLYYAGNWSPDGRRLTVFEEKSGTNTDIHVLDLETGQAVRIAPRDSEARFYPASWVADPSAGSGQATGFYLLTDQDREHLGLACCDLSAGQLRWVETPQWDVEHVAASREGRYLAWSVNEDGYSRLHARDLRTGRPVDVPALPPGVVGVLTMSRDGDKLGLLFNQPTHPSEVFVIDLAKGTLTQLTHGFLGGVDEADLVTPELIHFPTHDGRQIPALQYRPRGAGPFAVVLSIHGGPEEQERPSYAYAGLYQYCLSRGIGILAPNVRGSTGYGKSYQKLIYHDFGGDDLKDFEAAVKYLHSLAWVDRARMGVFGGSYGGYATLSCVSRLPDYWAAAVDVVGPSNLLTLATSVPPTWRRLIAELIGDPETEADFLLERSPLTYVDQIKAPLFVIQGAQDPRVVKSESDQIVERLRQRGVEVQYDVYEDEGHGFTKRENELRAWKATAEFFERYLLVG